MQLGGNTAGFCTDGNRCFVDNAFDQRKASALITQQRVAGDSNIFKIDFRSLETIDGWIVAAHDTSAICVNQEQRYAIGFAA